MPTAIHDDHASQHDGATGRDDEMAEFAAPPREPAVAPADLHARTFKRALVSLMPALLAIHEKRLRPVNLDLPAATTLVVGVTRALRTLRPEMERWFGEEMASDVDRLELVARAAAQAHAQYITADEEDDVQPLVAGAAEVRAGLVAEIASLGARKRIVPTDLGPLRGGKGYANLGFDVLQLVSFLTAAWEKIEHATGYSMAELEAAEGLANQLITAVGRRGQAVRSREADIRERAFTLLFETYDRVRRMVVFLRWEQGDADRIAPSLHRPRRGRRGPREAVDATEGPGATDPAPAEETLPINGR